MEKISGILPSSPRLQSTDMKEAQPVRPGMPSFGRPVGVSSLKGEPTITPSAPKSSAIQKEVLDWRSKDQRQAQIAAELSERFFIKNRSEAEKVEDIEPVSLDSAIFRAPVKSDPAGFKLEELGFDRGSNFKSVAFKDFQEFDEEPIQLQQPEGLYPKGSFLDRTA